MNCIILPKSPEKRFENCPPCPASLYHCTRSYRCGFFVWSKGAKRTLRTYPRGPYPSGAFPSPAKGTNEKSKERCFSKFLRARGSKERRSDEVPSGANGGRETRGLGRGGGRLHDPCSYFEHCKDRVCITHIFI